MKQRVYERVPKYPQEQLAFVALVTKQGHIRKNNQFTEYNDFVKNFVFTSVALKVFLVTASLELSVQ